MAMLKKNAKVMSTSWCSEAHLDLSYRESDNGDVEKKCESDEYIVSCSCFGRTDIGRFEDHAECNASATRVSRTCTAVPYQGTGNDWGRGSKSVRAQAICAKKSDGVRKADGAYCEPGEALVGCGCEERQDGHDEYFDHDLTAVFVKAQNVTGKKCGCARRRSKGRTMYSEARCLSIA